MSDKDNVKLKPFLNIRPGVYLTCLYAALLVVILFAVFVRPGIVNSGSVLTVNSEPWGAAVLVDGCTQVLRRAIFLSPAGGVPSNCVCRVLPLKQSNRTLAAGFLPPPFFLAAWQSAQR